MVAVADIHHPPRTVPPTPLPSSSTPTPSPLPSPPSPSLPSPAFSPIAKAKSLLDLPMPPDDKRSTSSDSLPPTTLAPQPDTLSTSSIETLITYRH